MQASHFERMKRRFVLQLFASLIVVSVLPVPQTEAAGRDARRLGSKTERISGQTSSARVDVTLLRNAGR
ncbi:MAG TPA: hypothetical protein VGH74_12965, partial [Planctomycetaceae bacterium]